MKLKHCKENQLITGIKGINRYSITTDKATLKITSITGTEDTAYNIKVKIIDHKQEKSKIGLIFDVDAKYFIPLKNNIKKFKE